MMASGADAVVSGGMEIVNTLNQIYEHSLQPNSARGNEKAVLLINKSRCLFKT